MDLRKHITFGLAFFSATAMAFPTAFRCDKSMKVDNFASLRHAASVIDKDDRGPLDVLGPQNGLTEEQIAQIRGATGKITCPGTKHGNGAVSSGAIIGDVSQVTTNAHAFIDEQGRPREPLSECTFKNSLPNAKPVRFNFTDGAVKFASENPFADKVSNDRVHVSLAKNIKGVKPLALDLSGENLKVGEEMFGISAYEEDYNGDPSMPIFRKFQIAKVAPDGALYRSNADFNRGGSGGVNIQIKNGQIVARGIFVSSFDTDRNGMAYNDNSEDKSKRNYSMSISLGPAPIRDIVTLAGQRKIYSASNSDSSSSPQDIQL